MSFVTNGKLRSGHFNSFFAAFFTAVAAPLPVGGVHSVPQAAEEASRKRHPTAMRSTTTMMETLRNGPATALMAIRTPAVKLATPLVTRAATRQAEMSTARSAGIATRVCPTTRLETAVSETNARV